MGEGWNDLVLEMVRIFFGVIFSFFFFFCEISLVKYLYIICVLLTLVCDPSD